MKKLSKIIAVLLTVCFMLSGCSYIDGEVFEVLENSKNSLFAQLNPTTSDVEGIEQKTEYPAQSDIEEISSSSEVEKEPLVDNDTKFWDYGNNGKRFTPISPYDYYGRNQLPIEHREVYDRIVLAINNLEPEVKVVGNITSETAIKIVNYVVCDYPQIFWLEDNFSTYTDQNGYVTSYALNYKMNKEVRDQKLAQLEAISRELISLIPANATEYEKALILHDKIIDMASYDNTFSLPNSYNLLGILLDGKGVCQAYAKAYQYLLYQVGMSAIYAKGESKGQGHAWNVVKINGSYYHTDITWNDPISRETNNFKTHTYFNITDSEIIVDHSINTKDVYILPKCSDTRENYFVKQGLVFESFNKDDVDRLARLVADVVNSNEDKVTIKLTDFDYLYDVLVDDGIMFDAINVAKKKYNIRNLNTKTASVSRNSELRTVTITLIFK